VHRERQTIHTGWNLQHTHHRNQWLNNSPIEPFDHDSVASRRNKTQTRRGSEPHAIPSPFSIADRVKVHTDPARRGRSCPAVMFWIGWSRQMPQGQELGLRLDRRSPRQLYLRKHSLEFCKECRPEFTNPIHVAEKPAHRTSDSESKSSPKSETRTGEHLGMLVQLSGTSGQLIRSIFHGAINNASTLIAAVSCMCGSTYE
jgi:hypothetical protein